jgi:hypothetical protein
MAMFVPRRCSVRTAICVTRLALAAMGGSVVPCDVGGAVDVVFWGGGVNLGMGGSARPKPGGGVGGGGKKLRGACASPGGGIGVKNGLAPAPFGVAALGTAATGGGVGVPGSGTTGMDCIGDDPRDDGGGGPSGVRAGGGGKTPEASGGRGAPGPCPTGITGGGGSVEAGVACAGAQCDVDGGGTEVPGVTSGSAEIGGAEVLTDGGGGCSGKGDDGGGGGAERVCAAGGGGTEREGGGGTDPVLRPGGGGTLRLGGGAAELPGRATGGALIALRGRVSDSKMSSASITDGRGAPLFVDAARDGVAGSDGARSIHSANSLDSRPCLAASMKLVSLLS